MVVAVAIGSAGVVWAARGYIDDAVAQHERRLAAHPEAASRDDLGRIEASSQRNTDTLIELRDAIGDLRGDVKAIRVMLERRRD